ncbi:MAG: hypothetical protein P4L42_16150, partial [Desulfocapsaceae bacterium]|nr:hypothetical protein [Desulfocapsaceae bacterium]
YWFEPAMLQGRDLLLVATSRDVIEGPIMQNHVRSMDPIQTLDIRKNNSTIDHFYIRLVHGYRGK